MGSKGSETHTYRTFQEVTDRLDGIVRDVRSKDTSLERSLDLFDEAIRLGSRAVELVDHTDLSPAEKELIAQGPEAASEKAEEAAAAKMVAELTGDGTAVEDAGAKPLGEA